jgi:hypothetical protein
MRKTLATTAIVACGALLVFAVVVAVLTNDQLGQVHASNAANSSQAATDTGKIAAMQTEITSLQKLENQQTTAIKAAKNATTARLGICYSYTTQSGGSETWVTYVSIFSPQVTSGVYQCPGGSTFVSVVPVTVG